MRTLEDIAEQLKECKEAMLARFEKGATIFDLSGLVNFLEEKLGTKVDVVSERAIRQELKEEILREVVMI